MHVKLPVGVFEHVVSVSSQLSVFMAHSSMSKQQGKSAKENTKLGRTKLYSPIHVPVVPSPVYPAVHVHVKLPAGVFVHLASVSSQLSVFIAHSSMSNQQGK